MKTISITKEGLKYLDERQKNIFVDFEECNENWLAYRKRTEKLTDDEIIALKEKDKIVGQRKEEGNILVVELFSKPFTKITFDKEKEYNKYINMIFEMMELGWTTMDWT